MTCGVHIAVIRMNFVQSADTSEVLVRYQTSTTLQHVSLQKFRSPIHQPLGQLHVQRMHLPLQLINCTVLKQNAKQIEGFTQIDLRRTHCSNQNELCTIS